jgi:hypothetical protein
VLQALGEAIDSGSDILTFVISNKYMHHQTIFMVYPINFV